MENMKILKRSWEIGIDKYALESSPLAEAYAEQLLDISIAGSLQSLQETKEELNNIKDQLVMLMDQFEQQSKGFRNRMDYKHKIEAYSNVLRIIVNEIQTYEGRIEANKNNNGRHNEIQS